MDKFLKWLQKFGITGKQAASLAGKAKIKKVKLPGISGKILGKSERAPLLLLNQKMMFDPSLLRFSTGTVGLDGRYYHLLREYELVNAEIARTAKYLFENNIKMNNTQRINWESAIDKWKRTNKELSTITTKFKKQNIKPGDAFKNYEKKITEGRHQGDVPLPSTVADLQYEMDFLTRSAQDLSRASKEELRRLGMLDQKGEVNFSEYLRRQLTEATGRTTRSLSESYHRATVRPFLIKQHEAGKIKLSDEHYKQLKEAADLNTGGSNRLKVVDPVAVFNYHYGKDALNKIPPRMTDQYVYTKEGVNELVKMFEDAGITVKNKASAGDASKYLSKDYIHKEIERIDEAMNNIAHGDDPFWKKFTDAEKQHTLDDLARQSQDYQDLLPKSELPIEVSGIDDTLKSDFEVISGDSKKGKEISEKLGITAKPGFPVTETGKADLKLVKASTADEIFRAELKTKLMDLPEFKNAKMTEADMDFVLKDVRADLGMDESYKTVMKNAERLEEKRKQANMDEAWKEATQDFPQSGSIDDMKKWVKDKETKSLVKTTKKKDRINIRLMKNFEKELDAIELAKEGYTLQEIDILTKARKVMKTENQNPNDALAWVRSEMADEAGIEFEEFMKEFDWGDFPGDTNLAQGGRVGLHRGSLRHQKTHDWKSYQKEGPETWGLYGSPPENWLSKLFGIEKTGYNERRDDLETYMKERFMYGEKPPPPNVFKEIFQDVQKLFNKKRNTKEDGGRVGYAMGSQGELTDLLVRLRNVVEGSGMYSSFSQQNRKSLQIALTSRINVLLGK